MKLAWDKWALGLGKAIIGGGSSAVVGGLVSVIAFKVDITSWAGAIKIMSVMLANFSVAGFLSMFFYLKQSPLPDPAGDTQQFQNVPITNLNK